MIVRALAMAGGLAGGVGLSQYPEFAQQYTQHLAGQIVALETVVADFDATADRSQLTRDEALAQMSGTAFLEDRRADMTRTFARFDALSDHFAILSDATPMQRLTMPHRMGDIETLRGTWENFVPALPFTAAGAVSAGAGFLAGWLGVGALLSLLAWPFRRRIAPQPRQTPPLRGRAPEPRGEPPLTRSQMQMPGE